MLYFKAKMHHIWFQLGASPRTPLAELTVLSQTLQLDWRDPTSQGRGGEKEKGEGVGRKRGNKREKGEEEGRSEGDILLKPWSLKPLAEA